MSKSPPASKWPLATAERSPMGAEPTVMGSSVSESALNFLLKLNNP